MKSDHAAATPPTGLDPHAVYVPCFDEVLTSQADDVCVLAHLAGNRYFELNKTGAQIWDILGDGATVDDVLAGLRAAHGELSADHVDDVKRYMRTLAEIGLIHPRED